MSNKFQKVFVYTFLEFHDLSMRHALNLYHCFRMNVSLGDSGFNAILADKVYNR